MNTVDALKALYTALGGSAETVENMTLIPEVINAIAAIVTGAELPAVSGSDNGKVLTVSSGAWAAADIPSQLPAVTGDDDGKVLKVIDGAWAVGTDATE